MRRHIFDRDGLVCRVCGAVVSDRGWHDNAAHIDHIVPLAKGGDMWDEANLQVLCRACNLSKGSKTMEEWEAHKAALATAEAERERVEIERTNYVQSMPLFDRHLFERSL